MLTCATTNTVNPKVRAIITKLAGPARLTTDAQPKKLSKTFPKNSANNALQMLLLFDFSSFIPRVSANFPMLYSLKQ